MEYYEYDYLMHHGIKGMKWGVRRYQNADGSLTSAGKKRYARIGATLERRGAVYGNRARYAINKQQKLQKERFTTGDASKMSEREKILYDKYVSNKKMSDKMYEIRKTAIKDLSDKEIQRGRIHVATSPAVGYFLAGPIGSIAVAGTQESRANKFIEEYERTH